MKGKFNLNKLKRSLGKPDTLIPLLVLALVLFFFWPHIQRFFNRALGVFEGFEGGVEGKELVLFHWNNCGHCKKMMPEWDKFAAEDIIATRKVEKDDGEDLSQYDINGYPTILLLDSSSKSKIALYEGPRTAKGFGEWVKSQ
jgi:thiol-disulfide isomerase/thioredoxin